MSSKFALIIGNTEYIDPGLAQLTAPGGDTEDFARVLKDQDIGAFDNVEILLNQSSSAVNEAIDEFFDQKKPDDLLVLYFSGHGVRDELGALYLAVKNTIRTRLRSTAIKSDYIREVMDQSRSKRQVLILDCCNSGAFSQGTKAATGVSIGTASAFEAGYGRIILTASDSTQFAWEGNKVIGETDNSLFTHYLIEGLEGEADLDGDGRITVDEVYDYAYEKVRLATPKQTPSKFSSKQQGEIVLRQNMRIEDIKPVSLPDELIEEIEDTRPYVREAAVQKLEKIIKGKNIGLARSARDALEKLAIDDNTTRRVAQMATQLLESVRQAERAEEERKAREEAERLAALRAEEERLAREKAEAEQRAKEEAEKLLAEQKADEERKAKKEAKRLAALKAKEERLAREKAEAERLAKQKAEEERKAQEEAERMALLKAEEERLAREKAERALAQKKAEEEHIANARLKTERLAAEKAEANRKAKEETERLLAEQRAEEERKAKEETERLAALMAEEERLVREQAEEVRRVKEEAEKAVREAAEKANKKAEREAKNAARPLWLKYGAIGTVIIVLGIWLSRFIPIPLSEGDGRIVFISNRDEPNPDSCSGNCNFEIYVMNADGSGQTRLTNNKAIDSLPSWSPDGKHIVFISDRDGNFEIYMMNADGSEQTRLTNNTTVETSPSWSPDNKHIVFTSDRDGNSDIYMMNADGSGEIRLTNNAASDFGASWSPDGKRIVFNSDRDDPNPGNCGPCEVEIYIMNADGSEQTRLTNNAGWDAEASWSPDGKHIVFRSVRDGNSDLYVMNPDGSEQIPLTNSMAYSLEPSWSPNGKYIAFYSDARDGNSEIYVMNSDGSRATRLTKNAAFDAEPVWQPTE